MANLGVIGRDVLAYVSVPAKTLSGAVTIVGGTVADSPGRRRLMLHRQSTGEFVNTTYSFVDGAFAIPSNMLVHNEAHYLVLLDDADGTPFNAQIFSDLYPV